MTPRRALGAAQLLLLAALLSGCRRDEGPYFGTTQPRHPRGTLMYGLGAEPQTIDPGRVYDSSGNELVRNLFEGLTRTHPATTEPVPGVAERWERSEDGLTWTFHLREAKWSDGVPISAADFVYAWRRVLDPRTGAQYASMLWVLHNGEAFNKGAQKDPAQLGVKALDPRTLEVRLQYPAPYFLHLTAYSPFFPVRQDVIERHGDQWIRPANIVSNGAFKLDGWRIRYEVVMGKNPHYWDAANVQLQKVVAMANDDGHSTMRLYKAGILDWLGPNARVPAENLPFVRHKLDYQVQPYLGVYFLWFNTQKKPLDDPRVRRALNLAVDKAKVTQFVTKAGQIPTTHFVPDVQLRAGGSAYVSPKGEAFDPPKARALLAEAGYPGGKGFPALTYTYNTDETHRQVAEAIQAMWREHLGIKVALGNVEWKVHLDNQAQGSFEIARAGWIGDYPEPSNFLELLRPGSAQNKSRWADPEYARLLDAGLRAASEADRNALYAQAEARILAAMPVLPLYIYTYSDFVKPYVRGVHPNIRHIHPLRDVWIEYPETGSLARREGLR